MLSLYYLINNLENMDFKKHIESKLEAEWVVFNDYNNAIRVLSNCVQWFKLITKYKELWKNI